MNDKIYNGINIQWPISELITSGKKTIETRTYAVPPSYLNQELLLIETPGKKGKFKARITAIIKFTGCFEYSDEEAFYNDLDMHCVTPDSDWRWNNKKKFGWNVEVIKIFKKPILCQKRGITFRKGIKIN